MTQLTMFFPVLPPSNILHVQMYMYVMYTMPYIICVTILNGVRYDESLECFLKLHNILRSSAQVLYHLADLSDKTGDFAQSTEW